MKSQISKLYKVTKPYTPTWEEIFALKPPLPETLVTVRTGNRKLDATMTKVLNRHPKFREAAERIAERYADHVWVSECRRVLFGAKKRIK